MQSNGTPQRYPRAVGNQPQQAYQGQLGWSFLDWFSDYKKPAPLARTAESTNFWNAGVNMAYGRERAYTPVASNGRGRGAYGGDTLLKSTRRAPRPFFSLWGHPETIGVEAFNRAKAHMDYGNPGAAKAELGDFFNDIMGTIVPGWDSRPEFLKNIVIKPDADKILSAVQKVAPNAGADIVKAANKAGFGVYVNTPGGQIEVSPTNAQNFYGMYPFLTKAQGAMGSVPTWIWIAGGVGILGLFLLRR